MTSGARGKRQALPVWIGLAFLAGVVVALAIPPEMLPWRRDAPVAEEAESEDHDHVMVTHAAQRTLGLAVAPAERGSLTEYVELPAVVRELPAVSNLAVSNRLQGVVRRVLVRVGQSVREGDPLMELDLTGDSLAATQANLLEAVLQLEIIDSEIERLEPVADRGGVAKNRLIDKQNERLRVSAQLESNRQKLLVNGLSDQQVDQILNEKTLVRTAVVAVPHGIQPQHGTVLGETALGKTALGETAQAELGLPSATAAEPEEDPWVFSIEELDVTPGRGVAPGDPLVHLAYHATLVVEGQAYERDLATVKKAQEGEVMVELGEDDQPIRLDGLKITYVDNHVDPQSQTYRLYVELTNSLLSERTSSDGRRYRTWRFKPGQRGHVLLPAKTWKGHYPLPTDAVAQDGLEWLVFRRLPPDEHPHDHSSAASGEHDGHEQHEVHDHSHEPPHDEFEAVPVTVLARTRRQVLVAGDSLPEGAEIAMSHAFQLLLTMKEGDGGHAHEHDHAH